MCRIPAGIRLRRWRFLLSELVFTLFVKARGYAGHVHARWREHFAFLNVNQIFVTLGYFRWLRARETWYIGIRESRGQKKQSFTTRWTRLHDFTGNCASDDTRLRVETPVIILASVSHLIASHSPRHVHSSVNGVFWQLGIEHESILPQPQLLLLPLFPKSTVVFITITYIRDVPHRKETYFIFYKSLP